MELAARPPTLFEQRTYPTRHRSEATHNQPERRFRAASCVPHPAPTPAEPIWTGGYVALLAANLLLCFGFYMLPSTLPAYVKQLGGSNLEASLVIGLFSVMSLGSRIISGRSPTHLTSARSSCRALS